MKSFISRGLSSLSLSSKSNTNTNTNTNTNDETQKKPTKSKNGNSFTTAPEESNLFTKVDPEIDGEDCLRDCENCTVRYPAKFKVEMSDRLYGNVKGWSTHVLVATGKTDWVRDVGDEKGSVMEAIDKGDIKAGNGKLKLSASNMPVPDEYHLHERGEQPTTVLILPAFTIVEHVTPALAPDLVNHFVSKSVTTTTLLPSASENNSDSNSNNDDDSNSNSNSNNNNDTPDSGSQPLAGSNTPESSSSTTGDPTALILPSTPLKSHPCPHAAVILLCSQRTRDARCGQSAPLLRKEFERHLRPLGLFRDLDDSRPGGVGIYFISHVGGHKYSANVMIYRRRDFEWFKKEGVEEKQEGEDEGESESTGKDGGEEGAAQGIWLARVRPEDCEGIIKHTVLHGKVIKPDTQLRGGFDREKGLISW